MSKRPTINMVAEKAGVSRGTVDRVINNRAHVRPDVYDKVMKAIEYTGYMSPRDIHQINMANQKNSKLILGVILPNWTGHFKWEIQDGIKQAAEELKEDNVEITIMECQSDIPDEYIEKIDELVKMGANGISLCATNDIGLNKKILNLKGQNIPVVTYNSDLPDSERICFIGQDYNKSGRIAAELVNKCTKKPCKILVAVGNMEFNGHRTRYQGFVDRMKEIKFPQQDIILIETFNDYQLTYKKISAKLAKTPEINAIYMANRSVSGCIKAVEDSKRVGEIRIVCHDLSERTKTFLENGTIDFSISQDLFQQGYQPLICLHEYLNKGKIPPRLNLSNNISIYCSQNI